MLKKLYMEFFHVAEDGKVRDKVLLTRVTVTVVFVVICLASMSYSAYAYFSHNVMSNANVVQTAVFKTEVTITPEVGEVITPVQKDVRTRLADLPAGTYTIRIALHEDSTVNTGFCQVEMGGMEYHTQQLGVDAAVTDGRTEAVEFTLTLTGQTLVSILDNWGASVYYREFREDGTVDGPYIVNGAELTVTASAEQEESEDVQSTTTTTTTTDEEETVTLEEETTQPTEETTAPTETEETANESTTVTKPVDPTESDSVDITTTAAQTVDETE